MQAQPTYSQFNCSVAYQLNWSLTVFGETALPSPEPVIDPLRECMARDRLKILEFHKLDSNVVQFFVSSQPGHAPSDIIRSLKGRWQHVAREIGWIKFRRNYYLASVGAARSEELDSYVARQNARHPMADAMVQELMESMQFHDPAIDPAELRRSPYGRYVNALQIVIENDFGWNEIRPDVLEAYLHMIRGTCGKHGWKLSRVGLLSNHLHILLAAGIRDSPESVGLALMNNMAYAQGSKPIFRYSYYAGTFGKYDRGAIWNTLSGKNASEAK